LHYQHKIICAAIKFLLAQDFVLKLIFLLAITQKFGAEIT